jgi:hypothetical protein
LAQTHQRPNGFAVRAEKVRKRGTFINHLTP